MPEAKIIELPIHNIKIVLGPPDPEQPGAFQGGLINAALTAGCDPEEDAHFITAMDAIESVILGHACAGIDVCSPAYLKGIETALEAVANKLT